MRVPYRGETYGKAVTRRLVWWQHERLLGLAFKDSPHTFLASHVAGDVNHLRRLGVASDNIWAVESNPGEYRRLFGRKQSEGFRLFTRKVECVVEDFAQSATLRSVYLDFCGNLQGTAKPTRRVISQLPENSVLSVTLFLGREHEAPADREFSLLTSLREHSRLPVTLVQSVSYASMSTTRGSAMQTWTFFVGVPKSRGKIRFDLRKRFDMERLAGSEEATRALWLDGVRRAERRSMAAFQANITRQLA